MLLLLLRLLLCVVLLGSGGFVNTAARTHTHMRTDTRGEGTDQRPRSDISCLCVRFQPDWSTGGWGLTDGEISQTYKRNQACVSCTLESFFRVQILRYHHKDSCFDKIDANEKKMCLLWGRRSKGCNLLSLLYSCKNRDIPMWACTQDRPNSSKSTRFSR